MPVDLRAGKARNAIITLTNDRFRKPVTEGGLREMPLNWVGAMTDNESVRPAFDVGTPILQVCDLRTKLLKPHLGRRLSLWATYCIRRRHLCTVRNQCQFLFCSSRPGARFHRAFGTQ
jgi:hypothetical protein